MRRIALLLALLAGASSCSSCESCKSESHATADASAPPTTEPASDSGSVNANASANATPAQPLLEAKASCRLLARAITQKACDCPQANRIGCCYFGQEPLKAYDAAAPHLDCSRGRTDWPARLEVKLCENAGDTAKATALTNCYAARDKLRCSRSPNGDIGAGLPKECESLFELVDAAK